jgi:predicted nucleic acid-binding protein
VRAVARGVDVLAVIELVAVSRRVLEGAVEPLPVELRSLDAIHLATAQLLGDDLARLVTYDERMASAARSFGWTVLSPS